MSLGLQQAIKLAFKASDYIVEATQREICIDKSKGVEKEELAATKEEGKETKAKKKEDIER